MSRLLDQVREATRRLHYSLRTEDAYVLWIKRFILLHGKRHPLEMGEPEVVAFLTHLAVHEDVAASTQNQALSACCSFTRWCSTGRWSGSTTRSCGPGGPSGCRSSSPATRPAPCSPHLRGDAWLAASLLYGSGLRLLECLRLRVKDVDFAQNHILVRDGKGQKDRATVLPAALVEPLRRQVEHVAAVHRQDLREGFGRVYLPHALADEVSRGRPPARLAVPLPRPTPRPRPPLGPRPTASPGRVGRSRRRSSGPSPPPGSPSTPVATPSATASPPTCSKPVTTSAPSRNCSATATSAPP